MPQDIHFFQEVRFYLEFISWGTRITLRLTVHSIYIQYLLLQYLWWRYIFAEETALISYGDFLTETVDALRDLTDRSSTWIKKWRIKPNQQKPVFMLFHHRLKPTSPSSQFHNTTIEPANFWNIKMDSRLNFEQHVTSVKLPLHNLEGKRYQHQNSCKKLQDDMKCRPISEYGHKLYETCN